MSMLKMVASIVIWVIASFRTNVAVPNDNGRGAPPVVVGGVVPPGGGS